MLVKLKNVMKTTAPRLSLSFKSTQPAPAPKYVKDEIKISPIFNEDSGEIAIPNRQHKSRHDLSS
jgi:hypothetical protein